MAEAPLVKRYTADEFSKMALPHIELCDPGSSVDKNFAEVWRQAFHENIVWPVYQVPTPTHSKCLNHLSLTFRIAFQCSNVVPAISIPKTVTNSKGIYKKRGCSVKTKWDITEVKQVESMLASGWTKQQLASHFSLKWRVIHDSMIRVKQRQLAQKEAGKYLKKKEKKSIRQMNACSSVSCSSDDSSDDTFDEF